MLKIPKYLEILKEIHAQFIIRSLKIPKENILFPPRPLILIPALFLHIQQESLYFPLEAPERSPAEEVVTRLAVFDGVEEAESVVDCVVAAEVVSVLLVALAVMNIYKLAVSVSNQGRKRLVGNHFVIFADVVK